MQASPACSCLLQAQPRSESDSKPTWLCNLSRLVLQTDRRSCPESKPMPLMQEAVTLAKRCLRRALQRGASRQSAARIAATVLTRAAFDRG